jgi:purine-binding chemotaxis protein CheW
MSDAESALPAGGSWDELALRAGGGAPADGEPEEIRQLLTFEVDSTPYALAVERVREILRIRPMTPVPRVSEDVCGVISLRGAIVQIIDLRRRLDLAPTRPLRSARIIVVGCDDGWIAGLLVDAVREVLRAPETAFRAAGNSESGLVESLCVRGEEFISLLDLDRILRIDAGT